MWTPYNPGDYQPYAARQRWFRTPNDAFMTGNFHVEAGLLTKLLKIEPFAPFQLVLASTYSGAFHPTAEGQAAIADAVVDKARAVLAKYGQGPDADSTGYTVPSPTDLPPPVAEPGVQMPDVKSVLSKSQDDKGPITGAIPPRVSEPADDSDIGAPDHEDKPTTVETIGVTSGAPGSEPPPSTVPGAAAPPQSIELRRSALPLVTPTPAPAGTPVPLATTVTPTPGASPPTSTPATPAEITAAPLPPPVATTAAPASSSGAEFTPQPFAPASGGATAK
jgi:hypothetical protein